MSIINKIFESMNLNEHIEEQLHNNWASTTV